MRYEAIWFVRLLATVSLMGLVFLAGVLVGRRAAVPRARRVPLGAADPAALHGLPHGRANLFAPELVPSQQPGNHATWTVPELPPHSSGDRSSR